MSNSKIILIDLDYSLEILHINTKKGFILPVNNKGRKLMENLAKNFDVKLLTKMNKISIIQWLIKNNLDDFICEIVDDNKFLAPSVIMSFGCFNIS